MASWDANFTFDAAKIVDSVDEGSFADGLPGLGWVAVWGSAL